MIKCEAVYKDIPVGKNKTEKKFQHFKVTIGELIIEPVPIGYLRISELKQLESMLQEAYLAGQKDGLAATQASVVDAGSEESMQRLQG